VAAGNHHRLLYHYADMSGVEVTLASGSIEPIALPLRGRRQSRAVVWLSEAPDIDTRALPVTAAGPAEHSADEPLARFTVAVHDAQHWRHWAARHKVRRRHRRELDVRGDGFSDMWWVVSRPIPSSEWLLVDEVETMTVLWDPRVAADH
jgi:hypothetical protein